MIFIIYSLFLEGEKNRKIFTNIFILFFGLILILAPWVYRNYQLSGGKIIPITKDNGVMLYYQIGRLLDSDYDSNKPLKRGNNPFLDSLGNDAYKSKIDIELEMDEYYTKKTINLIFKDPFGYSKIIFRNFYMFWAIFPTQYADHINLQYFIVGMLSFGIFFPFFFLGVIKSTFDRNILAIFVFLIVCYFTMIHSLVLGMIRYRIPVDFFIILFAAYGISIIYNKYNPIKKYNE